MQKCIFMESSYKEKWMKKTIILLTSFCIIACMQQKGTLVCSKNEAFVITDSREDDEYKAIKIGSQTWMAENLNYNAPGSKCYDNDLENCDKYGRLYDWSTAMAFSSDCNRTSCSKQIKMKHQGVCPKGWHLPSYAEWKTLKDYVGSDREVGVKLKSVGGWKAYYHKLHDHYVFGTDEFGFSALPGGLDFCVASEPERSFNYVGRSGYWWSSSEEDSLYAYDLGMHYDSGYADRNQTSKRYLLSVRCLQD
jgi:uncharacterized protein (TIGR02145 family)